MPVALSSLLAASCAAGPDYGRRKVTLPSHFRFETAAANAESLADLPWWKLFRDDALRALVQEALRNNYDLLVATARVDAARAQARASGAQLLPSVSIAGTGSYGNSFQGASAANKSYYTAGVNGSVSLDVDLFGRLRRTAEAARAEYAASEEARRGVWVTLLADVGQTYFQLRSLDIPRSIDERTVIARTKTLEFFRVRADGGIGTDLDVARAEADLAGAKATLANLQRQIALNEDAVSILLGRPPRP